MNANPEMNKQGEPSKSIVISREQLNHIREYLKGLVHVKYTEEGTPIDPTMINKLEPAAEQTTDEPNKE